MSTGRKNSTKKSPLGDSGDSTQTGSNLDCHPSNSIKQDVDIVNMKSVEVAEFASAEPWVTIQVPYSSTPTPLINIAYDYDEVRIDEVVIQLNAD